MGDKNIEEIHELELALFEKRSRLAAERSIEEARSESRIDYSEDPEKRLQALDRIVAEIGECSPGGNSVDDVRESRR